MKIGKYISELLFEKDFVILPGFGEFSTKYIPARFVPELKKVEKPSKIIAFSDRRKDDDNVLTDYIAKKENIDQAKAKSFINAFVQEMSDTLKTGKSVELENVGKFSPGVGGSFTFEPDKSVNYLKDTIGMDSVKEPGKKPTEEPKPEATKPTGTQPTEKPGTKPTEKPGDKPSETQPAKPGEPAKPSTGTYKPEPLKKEPSKTEPGKPADKKETITEAKTPVSKPKEQKPAMTETAKPKGGIQPKKQEPSLSPAMKWVAFVAIPLLVIIIIFAFNFKFIVGDPTPGRESVSLIDRIKGIFVEMEEPEAPSTEPIAIEEETIEPIEEEPARVEPEVTRPEHEPEPGRTVYHIVVGSFIEKHNAEIFAEDLREKGAPKASLFEQARTGHYRVSYGFYYSLGEAERQLETVKQTVNTDAWILKR